jgi:hypothetical protein
VVTAAEQLDLFTTDEPDTYATPTKSSATGVMVRVATRVGYDYVSACRWCEDFVILAGEWRPDGWTHKRTGHARCLRPQRRRGDWRMPEDGGLL